MAEPLKVLFLASEMVPFIKTGGLADVAGALPAALRGRGVDVRVVLPLYRSVRDCGVALRRIEAAHPMEFGRELWRFGIWEATGQGDVPVWLIDREDLYDRPEPYGGAQGDYYDNLERFSFYARAALEVALSQGFVPDVIHCHDWQTGLVPTLVKTWRHLPRWFAGVPCAFTIHNVGYQGCFLEDRLELSGLERARVFHVEGLEYWGKASLLKAGIVYSDAVTTVSPTYAEEICTPELGMGMDGILTHRKAVLSGILNGADYSVWSPEVDEHLPRRYGPDDLAGKAACKAALAKEMGIAEAALERPLFGMVSRLAEQKGLELLVQAIDAVVDELDASVVLLGSGEERYEEALRAAAARHPGRIGVQIGYDEALAHQVIAGVDFQLVPSRYEPCGLTQIYSMRYGTVPVVRATGGLADTVQQLSRAGDAGTGFLFEELDAEALLEAMRQAVACFEAPGVFARLQARCMAQDFSWGRSAQAYQDLYQGLVDARREQEQRDEALPPEEGPALAPPAGA